jgi:hypothetical protein
MLRRETHALRKGNGKAPEAFYGEHAGHVRDALRPAATSMCALLNRPGLETRIDQALNELAGRRHAQDIDVAATAAFEARELMTRLAEICK